MTAAVWTAIGLLAATSLGTLFYLGARIDSLSGSLGARIDSLGARVDTRFDALEGRMESRFSAMEARFDSLNARLDEHIHPHAG